MTISRRAAMMAMGAGVGLRGAARIEAITSGPKHHFYGYYGVSPWNQSGKKLVCLESDFQVRMPRPGEKARVCLVDTATRKLSVVAETWAWNLQQGCMLNWNPLRSEDEIFFNDEVGGELISVGLDVNTGKRRQWQRAIESVGAGGRWATSVTYGRLMRLRPVVGYASARDPFPKENHPAGDGVWVTDLESGRSRLAVSLRAVFEKLVGRHPELKEKAMFIQHSVLNPSSTRFFFLARTNEGGKLTSAMFSAALDGSSLREVVPFAQGVSHFAWRGDAEIMATFQFEGKVRHVLFADVDKPEYRVVGDEFLQGDGHCSFGPDRDVLVTDRNVREPMAKMLMTYDMKRKVGVHLGTFPMETPSGEKYLSGDTRCDLHPRWKPSGDQICFDALDTKTWTRQVHVAYLRG